MKTTFHLERTTPGTVVYKENGPKELHKVGTLDIQKRSFPDGNYPSEVMVEISPVSATIPSTKDL